MRKKLRSQRGDTLTARINAGVRQTDTALKYDAAEGEKKPLTITRENNSVTKSVKVYETKGGYRYYTHE